MAYKRIIMTIKKIGGLLGGLLSLSTAIIVHELGHFLTCKIFNVATPVFSIGFGPTLLSYKIGATTFQIAALPLGGYVAIDQIQFAAQSYMPKLIIMLAGIVFNILFALFVFIYFAARGKYEATSTIEKVIPNSPAQHAGLRPGDTITHIDNVPIDGNVNVLLNTIMQRPGQTVSITFERDSLEHTITVTLADSHPVWGSNIGFLGTPFASECIAQSSPLGALRQGTKVTFMLIKQMAGFAAIAFRQEGREGVTGPIGILHMMSKSFLLSSDLFLLINAFLHLNLALFNLLPIPVFDGGKILITTIEAIYGPLPSEILGLVYFITIVLLVTLAMLITIRDIKRLRARK